jgi:hypothetical protein
MRKIFSRFLLPHCYSQRALFFVPRNLPCLISRAWVQCLPLRSSHLYLNQRPAKTTISTREGSGVAQRRNRRASLSTRTASCRCRSIVEQARCGKSGSAPPPLLPTIFLHQPTRSCDFLRSLAAVAATKGAIDMGPRAKMQRVGATGIRGMLHLECPLSRGYCCKSRKSNNPENLAEAALSTSLQLDRFSTRRRRSVIDFR